MPETRLPENVDRPAGHPGRLLGRLFWPIAGVAAAAILWVVFGLDGGGPPLPEPVAEVAVLPPPPPPPPQRAVREVAGSAGTVLPVAPPEALTVGPDALTAAVGLAERTGTAALLVWHRGALQLEHYATDVRPFDRLPGRGLEAGVLVLLTGILAERGVLESVDMPLGRLVEEWAEDPRGTITLRQLLTGTSGLGDPGPAPLSGLLAWTLSAPLVAEPGSRFAPSRVEAQLLGLALSRAAGRPLHELLGEVLWRPLGARPATLEVDPADATALVDCCLEATARDWLRLGLLLLEDGARDGVPLVSAGWLAEMHRPIPHARNDGLRLRLAWPREPDGGSIASAEPFAAQDTVFLAGSAGQRIYVSQAAELVIVRLGLDGGGWDEAALPNLIVRAASLPEDRRRLPRGPTAGPAGLPPIVKPPPIPTVEAVPLDPPPAPQRP